MKFRQKTYHIAILTVLCAIAAVVYTHRIAQESIWNDEWFTIHNISQPTLQKSIDEIVYTENTPPLYFLLLRLWTADDTDNIVRIRLFSVVWAIGALIAAYLLAVSISGRGAALITGLLMVGSPYILWYAQEARNPTMEMCIALLLAGSFYRYEKTRSARWLLLTAVIQLAGLYTHYYFVFMIPVQFIYLCLFSSKKQIFHWTAAMIPAGLLFAFWIPNMLEQIAMARSGWLQQPSLYFPIQLFSAFSVGLFFILRENVTIAAIFLFTLLFAAGIFVRRFRRDKNWTVTMPLTRETLLPVLCFFIPLLCAYLISFIKPIAYEGKRYLILILPFFYIIIARGALSFQRQWVAALVTVAMLTTSSIFMNDIYSAHQKRYWKRTARLIEKLSKPGDALFSTEYTDGNVLTFYGTGYAKLIEIPDFKEFRKSVSPYRRLWYVAYVEGTFEEKLLDSAYRMIEAKTFSNPVGYHIRLVLYDCSDT